MAEPVLMMSDTAHPELIDVSPDCREQICCDSLLPALVQEQVWLAGYSRLKTRYRISRRFADVHCFLLTLGGEGEVQVGDRRCKSVVRRRVWRCWCSSWCASMAC